MFAILIRRVSVESVRAFLTDCFDGLREDVSLDMPDIVWFDGA